MQGDLSVRGGPMRETKVLVVDLDGTLVRTDTLWEALWAGLTLTPGRAIAALGALAQGKAAFKAALGDAARPDPRHLPYEPRVIAKIEAWRAEGGRAVLCSAADERIVREVSAHLGLFDDAHGSTPDRNLKGPAKAAFLAETFGREGFHYVGDAAADLPVWRVAHGATSVGLAPATRRTVETGPGGVEHLDRAEGDGAPAAYLRLLRPHQWLKNLLIFLPLIAAHTAEWAMWGTAVLAFAAFSLVASGVYVLNDLLDLAADRAHPRKRHRPLAAGTVPIAHGTMMVPGLFLAGLAVALLAGSWPFVAILGLYFLLTSAYSFWLKRKPILDICLLAGLYTLRIIAGGLATGIPLSVWLLAFSTFFFLALAAVKRQGELVSLAREGRVEAAGRGYRAADRPIVTMMALAAGYVSVLVLALYVDSPAVEGLYSEPYALWAACPVLLYWLSRLVLITERGEMTDDPIVFAIRDRISYVAGALIVITGLLAGVL